jgi:hypothetical protein
VISKVQAFIDYRIDVSSTMLAGTFAGMLQHVFHDGVGALAMLHDLLKVVFQQSTSVRRLRSESSR